MHLAVMFYNVANGRWLASPCDQEYRKGRPSSALAHQAFTGFAVDCAGCATFHRHTRITETETLRVVKSHYCPAKNLKNFLKYFLSKDLQRKMSAHDFNLLARKGHQSVALGVFR